MVKEGIVWVVSDTSKAKFVHHVLDHRSLGANLLCGGHRREGQWAKAPPRTVRPKTACPRCLIQLGKRRHA